VVRPLAGLLVQLEAVARGTGQVRDQMGTDVVPESLQLSGQATGAPRGPPHRGLGATRSGGLDERLEVRHQFRVFPGGGRPPPAGSSDAPKLQPLPGPDLPEPSGGRRTGETGGLRDEADPSMAEGERLRRRPVPAGPLGEFRGEGGILGPDGRELHARARNGSRTYSSLIQKQPLNDPPDSSRS
jgi:hypothetical protein